MNTETILLPLWLLMELDPNWVANTSAPRQPRFATRRGRTKAIKKSALEKELAFEVEFETTFEVDYKPAFDSYNGSQSDTPTGSVPVGVSAAKPSAKHFEPKAWKHVKANY
jgi:hypothetical protein